MTIRLETKKNFLKSFQEGVIQGRKLLFAANHRWGDRLLTDLYFKIEKCDWLDIQKKHQLIRIIVNSWWMYINSLTQKKHKIDLIRYIDAYKRFFSYLAKLDDFYLLNNFMTKLLKEFIQIEDLSISGITNFINSFSIKVREKEDYLKLIELQILLTFLRKSVFPQEFFHLSMELIGRTIFKIEPGKRGLFLYILLESINLNYQLSDNSDNFVTEISKMLIHRVPSYLRSDFNELSKIHINNRNYREHIEEFDELIHYLNNIGETSWIILIIKSIFEKLNHYVSYGDAVTYIRKFINFSVNRNRFELAFEIYDFLENLFLEKADLGYDNLLIELWVEAAEKFVSMNEKRFLLQSLEKLNTHLKLPQTREQIFHYFYTSNVIWQFKSIFFSLDQRDFWRMMFYRAVFEEKDFELGLKIIPFLDKKIQSLNLIPSEIYDSTSKIQEEIYTFEDGEYIPKSLKTEFDIKHMILRIDSNGLIKYRIISLNEELLEGRIHNEYWNDAHLIEVFTEIFSEVSPSKFNFSLKELGKLMYIFLPKSIRNLFNQFRVKSLQKIPEIYFILDQMTIPFELIYDNNFFLLKYSIGYIIGEPPLEGISFENRKARDLTKSNESCDILIIESINSSQPLIWNEKSKKKKLLFPFMNGKKELDYILNFFGSREEINSITILDGAKSTRDNVLNEISSGKYSIIHFIGNIFYSKWNPYNSFFLTNNNTLVTFQDINKAIKSKIESVDPLLFFGTQIFDTKGAKIKNAMRSFGDIIKNMDFQHIKGIIARVIPIFNDETQAITSSFYLNFLSNSSQGMALLKARQECMAQKMATLIEQEIKGLDEERGSKNIDIQNTQAISSFILYGQPWKKIN